MYIYVCIWYYTYIYHVGPVVLAFNLGERLGGVISGALLSVITLGSSFILWSLLASSLTLSCCILIGFGVCYLVRLVVKNSLLV